MSDMFKGDTMEKTAASILKGSRAIFGEACVDKAFDADFQANRAELKAALDGLVDLRNHLIPR